MSNNLGIEDRYIGDGVYASYVYDGNHIILDLRAQDNTTRIALEPKVFAELQRFAADVEARVEAWRNRSPPHDG